MRTTRAILHAALATALLAASTIFVPRATAQPSPGKPSQTARVLGGGSCAMLDVRVVFPDSVIATVPWNGCGPAQLVIAQPPKFVSDSGGRYTERRHLPISVVVRNAETKRFSSPIELRGDSLTPFWRGQQLPTSAASAFLGSSPTITPQYNAAAAAVFGTQGRSSGGLEPGEVSRSFEFTFTPGPQTDHFRVWFDLRRQGAVAPYPAILDVKHPPSDRKPLGTDVDAFIASAHLPMVHERTALLRIPDRDLLLFTVSYGPAQDCGMKMITPGTFVLSNDGPGCIYSRAIGLKFGRKIGWIEDKPWLGDTPERARWKKSMFPLSSADQYVMSVPFLDTLTSIFGRYYYVSRNVMAMVLAHPAVPRATLAHLAERVVYDDNIAGLLLAHPTVMRDPELLLTLATLPGSGSNGGTRRMARDALMALAPSLIANPATPARTLFLLATDLPICLCPKDSLFKRIAEHPNARGNLALQIVTHQSSYLSLVHASPRVRAMLERYVRGNWLNSEKSLMSAQLLADPEAGHDPDVLLVLANGSQQELVAWEATRRLPPTALLRLETQLAPPLPAPTR